MWVSSSATFVVKQREGCQQFVALTYVPSVYEEYLKSHKQQYFKYMTIIDFHMSQNIMQAACPVLVHKSVKYDIHTICDVRYLLYS